MATIEKSIDVKVPIRAAYDQWTQFEEFPRFMEGVKEVRQLDDKRLHWVAEIGGKRKEWEAEIVEQIPDQKIAWRSTSGPQNDGIVTFQPKDEATRITLRMTYEPEGAVESVGSAVGVPSGSVEGDLGRFKDFIEGRGVPTGAWRGRIEGERVEEPEEATRERRTSR